MVELDLKQHIAEQFLQFAEIECKASTPFYYYLSQFVANDNTMLELASYCSSSQPRPNLLFAAIQFLLQSNEELPGKENLKEWYPSLTNNPKPVREIELPIQFFISQNREQIIELLQTRLVQTNEVRRSTFLYPAFLETERRTYNSPLALIEIGTSASLNMGSV